MGRNPLPSIRYPSSNFRIVSQRGNPTARKCISGIGGETMAKIALWVVVESNAGNEKELEEFLKSAQPLA
jgi:hypothetical protein